MAVKLPKLPFVPILLGLGMAEIGVHHWNDPPVEWVYHGWVGPSKWQYTYVGIGALLIVMGLALFKRA